MINKEIQFNLIKRKKFKYFGRLSYRIKKIINKINNNNNKYKPKVTLTTKNLKKTSKTKL